MGMQYKDFYSHLIVESPTDISYGDDTAVEWDDPKTNKKELMRIKKDAKFEKEISVGGKTYRMYKEERLPFIYFYFLNMDESLMLAAHSFKEIMFEGKPTIQNSFIWKMRSEKGFMKHWFLDYVSKKYSAIMSDISLSKHGFAFWQWLYDEFVTKQGCKMIAYDKGRKTKFPLKSQEDLSRYHGWESINRIFVLYTK